MVLSPQAFHNVNVTADIFNHCNINFWEYAQHGYDALGFISCTGVTDNQMGVYSSTPACQPAPAAAGSQRPGWAISGWCSLPARHWDASSHFLAPLPKIVKTFCPPLLDPYSHADGALRCAGTNFLTRSTAFQQAGWSPEFTLTEDFALGMELKKHKWHCRWAFRVWACIRQLHRLEALR